VCSRMRTGAYDDYGLVAQGEADLSGKLAGDVRKVVGDWIRKNHAGKITKTPIGVGRLSEEIGSASASVI